MISLYTFSPQTALSPWRSACLAAFDGAAGPEERARLARLRRDEDRLAFRLNGGFLRLVLADAAACDPMTLALSRAPGGKPVCDGLFFNMSHARGLSVAAVSDEIEVGVDVEALSCPDGRALSVPMAVAEEDRAVLPLLCDDPGRAETILWSIKEAALKLTGDVMVDPAHLTVSRRGDGAFRITPARAARAPFPDIAVRLVQVDGDQVDDDHVDGGHVVSLATYAPVAMAQIVVRPRGGYDAPRLSTTPVRPASRLLSRLVAL